MSHGWPWTIWLTLKTIWLPMYGNDLGNHMVDYDDVIVKRCVKLKVRISPRGNLTLSFSWFSWTFLRSYFKANPKKNCNKPWPRWDLLAIKIITIIIIMNIIPDFKLSQCSECCILSFGWFLASEFYVPTFRNTPSLLSSQVEWTRRIFLFTRRMKMEQCSETSAHNIQTPGIHPKEIIQQWNIS